MMNYALIGLSLVAFTIGSVQAQSKFNPGYLVAELEIIDAASMQKFGEAASPIVKAYGGEFLARNGRVVAGFGTAPKSVTIIKVLRRRKLIITQVNTRLSFHCEIRQQNIVDI
jgi:uncharacterized protein (DUF1330 family)